MKEPIILFENKNLLVISKPSGLVVHSDGKTKEANLCDWLLEKYPNIKEVGEPGKTPQGEVIYRPGIVHRLDRETSGAMVVAKTQETFEYLKEQFKNREVHKTYHTFVWGLFKEMKGTVDRSIGRSKSDFRKWSAGRFARGEMREASTDYKVLGEVTLEKQNYKITPSFSLVECHPLTGRTHQIRVHMHFLHHPVVGDGLYAPNHPKALGFERCALHSRSIEFNDLGGGLIKIEAPYPEDFERAVGMFDK
jgi:23S rRNA pseudouridine1911/1915/1917 synthase